MSPIRAFVFLSAAIVSAAGCGEADNSLVGSWCKVNDCSFDTVRCSRYEPPNHAIKVNYEKTKTGREYTAMILCQLYGIDQAEGTRLQGQDFLDRCSIYRPSETYAIIGNFCEYQRGCDQAGGKCSGKCAFNFQDGTKLTARFSCTFEELEL